MKGWTIRKYEGLCREGVQETCIELEGLQAEAEIRRPIAGRKP